MSANLFGSGYRPLTIPGRENERNGLVGRCFVVRSSPTKTSTAYANYTQMLRRMITALRDARRNKERTYPELLRDRRCRLVVFGIEVGGRWSDEAATFLRLLAPEAPRPHQSSPSPSPTAPLPHQRPDPPLERHAPTPGHACLRSIPP